MNNLAEIEAIKMLKHKYMRCLDTKLWDGLADCFIEDATTSYSDGKLCFQGKNQIADFLKEAMPPTLVTMHQCFHPEIELTSDTTAKGTWGFQDYLIITDINTSLRGYGIYHDEYVKVDGKWRIKSTGYKRVFEETWDRADLPSLNLTENMFASKK
jgi:bile-acid 7alpha-dehydratase